MYKNKRGRTKKEFEPYNEYKDRPFWLKWGTAFAIKDEQYIYTTFKLVRRIEKILMNNKQIMKKGLNINKINSIQNILQINRVMQFCLKSI